MCSSVRFYPDVGGRRVDLKARRGSRIGPEKGQWVRVRPARRHHANADGWESRLLLRLLLVISLLAESIARAHVDLIWLYCHGG